MEISLAAETISRIGALPITNSLVHSAFTSVLFILGSVILAVKGLSRVPKGFQNGIEFIIEKLLHSIESITGDRKKAVKFFPLVSTIFLFLLVSNYIGLLPFVGPLGVYEIHEGKTIFIPLFRSAAADMNTTLSLALISVIATHLFGVAGIGLWKHAGRFINPKLLLKNPILFFVGLLEMIGEIAKIVSFSFRLFGNIFAGEVLLIVIGSLVAYIAPIPFYFLELFVGFIQALVFATLTLVFLTMATSESHH